MPDQDQNSLAAGESSQSAWNWRWMIAAIVFAAVGVGVTLSAWQDILDIALHDEEASHIWLVPIIVAWLAATRHEQLANYRPHLDPMAGLLILIGWAISTYGFYHHLQSFWHGGVLLLVVGCFLTIIGTRLVRVMPAVFVALLFLIPIPGMSRQSIALPMQTATAAISQLFYEILALPVERSGNLLRYNGVEITIAEACNGMRMVFTLLSVCYVFAFGSHLRTSVRLLVLVLSPVVAIACNVIRVVPTIWMYGHYSNDVATTFHDYSGWVMIFVSFLLLMGFVRLLEWAQIPIRPNKVVDRDRTQVKGASHLGPAWLAVVIALLALGIAVGEGATRPIPADAEPYHQRVVKAADELPDQFGDWVGEKVQVPVAAIQLLQPNVIVSKKFHNTRTNENASILIVHCKDARDLAGHYPPTCYPNFGWLTEGQEAETWRVAGRAIPGMDYHFSRGIGLQHYQMVVANLLVMPRGEYLRDMSGVRRAASDHASHFFGAAQVQVVMSGTIDPDRRHQIVAELFDAHRPMLEAMTSALEKPVSSIPPTDE